MQINGIRREQMTSMAPRARLFASLVSFACAMRRAGAQSLAVLVMAGVMGGCASLPGANYPKTPSTALAQPEETRLGKNFAAIAREREGKSGYRLLTQGIDGFLTRIQMADAAEQTLDLQYFIFRADETGKLLADAVLHAADRGVRVRVLLDDGETVDGDEQLVALAAHPRIQIRMFNPFGYRGHSVFLRGLEFSFSGGRLDYRMHNKLMVVDNSIALLGGRNVGDQYFQVKPDSQFADDDVFAVGPMVERLSGTFDEFWNSAIAIPIQALAKERTTDEALAAYRKVLAGHQYEKKADGSDYVSRIKTGEPLASLLSGRLPVVWADAQLVCDPPDKMAVERDGMVGRLMHRSVAKAVAGVQTELLMITPYLVPGEEGMQLFAGLRQRDVRVRILTSSLESSNVILAHSGYVKYRVPLLEQGVQLYEIRSLLGDTRGSGETARLARFGNYSLHAKLFVFDRQRLFIGSMNFDQRSMHLNTEIGLIIDSPELAAQTVQRFEAMVRPANSYAIVLVPRGGDRPPVLAWRTEENGRAIQYDKEPARTGGQRFMLNALSLLPLDAEL